MDVIAAIEDLQKRVAELESRNVRVGPLGPSPSVNERHGCVFCGKEHGGLPCPKLKAIAELVPPATTTSMTERRTDEQVGSITMNEIKEKGL